MRNETISVEHVENTMDDLNQALAAAALAASALAAE